MNYFRIIDLNYNRNDYHFLLYPKIIIIATIYLIFFKILFFNSDSAFLVVRIVVSHESNY